MEGGLLEQQNTTCCNAGPFVGASKFLIAHADSFKKQMSGVFLQESQLSQRTSWGGGKKRGVENLTNDTPPKKRFWTPPRTVRFPPLSGVSALFFLYKTPRQSRPEALLEGSKNFRESAFSGTLSSPHTFCTPPISPSTQRALRDILMPRSEN